MKRLILFIIFFIISLSLNAKISSVRVEFIRLNTPTGHQFISTLDCKRECVFFQQGEKKSTTVRKKVNRWIKQIVNMKPIDERYPRLQVKFWLEDKVQNFNFALPTKFNKELKIFLELEKFVTTGKL